MAKDTFLKVPGILTVHNLRIWGLTTDKTALSAHLVIGKHQSILLINIYLPPETTPNTVFMSCNDFILPLDSSRNAQEVLKEASTKIRGKYNIYEMTLQVEEFQDDMDDCTQCQDSPDK